MSEITQMDVTKQGQSKAAAATQQQPAAAVPTAEANAIMVDRELLSAVRQELKARLPADHVLPSSRDILDFAVREMGNHMIGLYSTAPRREVYKWFDSDVAKQVQARNDIKDKGRFVDACLIAYLYGEEGVRKWCTSIRVARLPALSTEEKDRIARYAAAMAAIEGEELSVRPAPSLAQSEN